MQAMPPVFVAAPLVERPQAVSAVQGPAETGSSGANGEADNPDARDTALASDRAREIARLITNRSDEEQLIPGFPPLDTREVGDQDIIDPDRPAVRGPEPLTEIELPEGLPPLPDEFAAAENPAANDVDAPDFGTAETDAVTERAETPSEERPAPVAAAQPASPGASAPDVPEPPAPGAVDIRR